MAKKDSYLIEKGKEKTTGRVTYGRDVADSGLSYLEVHLGLGEDALRTMVGGRADKFYARNIEAGFLSSAKTPTGKLMELMGAKSSAQIGQIVERQVQNVFKDQDMPYRGSKGLDVESFVENFGSLRVREKYNQGALSIQDVFSSKSNIAASVASPTIVDSASSVKALRYRPTNTKYFGPGFGPKYRGPFAGPGGGPPQAVGGSSPFAAPIPWGSTQAVGSQFHPFLGNASNVHMLSYGSLSSYPNNVIQAGMGPIGNHLSNLNSFNNVKQLTGLDIITQNTPNKRYVPNFTGGFNTYPNLHREVGTSGVHPSLLNPVAAAAEGRRHQRNFEAGIHQSISRGRAIAAGDAQAASLDSYRSSMAHVSPGRNLTEMPGKSMGNYGYENSLHKRMDLQKMSENLYSEIHSSQYPSSSVNTNIGKSLSFSGQGRDSAMQAALNLLDAGNKPVASGSILEAATEVINSGKGKGSTNIISSPKEKKDKSSYSALHPYGAISFAEGHYSPWDAGQTGATSGGPRGRIRRAGEELSAGGRGSWRRAFMGTLGGGEGGKGGFGSQALTQLRHAAIWQAYTPVIAGVSYGVYRAFTGDPGTDRAAHSLIGIGASEQQRMGATQWSYNKSNNTPFSTPTQFLKGYKETASGLGISLTDKTAPMLQKAAEKARLFSMFSMEDPNVAARRLSRATLMESKARGIDSAEGKMSIFNRLSNNLAGLYAESSTRGQETDVAMHYMGPASLGKMRWGYDEAAAVNSHFVEQGIAGSTSGVFFRNIASNPNVMAEAMKARMFWEKAYENKAIRGGKELQRQDLPLSYLNRSAWTTNGMDKNPEKAARVKEMLYRSSQGQKTLKSGNKTDQFKLIGQMSQDWLRLQEAGIKGLAPPQAMTPMVEMIGQQTPTEFANTMTGQVGKVTQTPHQLEGAETEGLRISTPGVATSVIGNQWAEWFAKSFMGKGTVTYAKNLVGRDLTSQLKTLIGTKGVTAKQILEFSSNIQRERNAGVITDEWMGWMKGQLKNEYSNIPFFGLGEGRNATDRAQLKEAYDKLGGDATLKGSQMLPVPLQSEGMQRITEERMKKEGKSIADIIKEGFLQVHIDPQQVTELSKALGGADPYSVKELPGGELQIQLKPPTRKPESATNPPHNGVTNASGAPYTWSWGNNPGMGGSGVGGPPVSGGVITQ